MKQQLDLNENLLPVYFNIMILCKQFNSNKSLNINIENSSKESLNPARRDSTQELQIITTPTRKLHHIKSSFDVNEKTFVKLDYDADSELSVAGKIFKKKES